MLALSFLLPLNPFGGFAWWWLLNTWFQVTDKMMQNAEHIFPQNTPTSKEAYYYRTIFERFFPQVIYFHQQHCWPIWVNFINPVLQWLYRTQLGWPFQEDQALRAAQQRLSSGTLLGLKISIRQVERRLESTFQLMQMRQPTSTALSRPRWSIPFREWRWVHLD